MIEHILCPVDFSESSRRALRWAGYFASKFGAELTLLHVLEVSRFSRGGITVPPDFLEELRHRAEHELSDVAWSSREHVHVEVADGDLYEVILDRADRLNVDLLVMSSRRHSAVGRFLKGSLTERVMDHIAIPVLVVTDDLTEGRDSEPTLRTILMAVDFGLATTSVIHTAFEFADRWKAKLLALHVVAPSREVFADRDGFCWLSDEAMEHLEVKLKNARRRRMVNLLRQLHPDTSGVELITVEGRAPEKICSIARERDVDLVLLGAHGHSMRPLGWMGSTCHKMVQSSCCPTFIVKTAWPHGARNSSSKPETSQAPSANIVA
jgi:nucleotide-binding universal stress UspA family protein